MGSYDDIKELNRLGKRRYLSLIFFVGGFAGCALLAAFIPSYIWIILGIASAIFGLYLAKDTDKKNKSIYKSLFVQRPLEENFDNMYYDWQSGFSSELVRNFSLCKMGNRFNSEDYIRAEYQGVPFEMSDVTVQYHTSGKHSHTTTYFRGRILIIEFPEKMVNSVQIFSKAFKYRAALAGNMKAQNVEMESVRFNKEFDVHAVSPHDAFYLITPPFMERLYRIEAKVSSVAMHAFGNKIVIGFNEPTNNAFDSKNLFKNISYQEEMNKVQRDIDDIKELISIIRNLPQQTSENGRSNSFEKYNEYDRNNGYYQNNGYEQNNNYGYSDSLGQNIFRQYNDQLVNSGKEPPQNIFKQFK